MASSMPPAKNLSRQPGKHMPWSSFRSCLKASERSLEIGAFGSRVVSVKGWPWPEPLSEIHRS